MKKNFRPLDNLVSKWYFKTYWSIKVSHSLILTQKRVGRCQKTHFTNKICYILTNIYLLIINTNINTFRVIEELVGGQGWLRRRGTADLGKGTGYSMILFRAEL
jgi:hypothetical protein